jgi:hypothetical protein
MSGKPNHLVRSADSVQPAAARRQPVLILLYLVMMALTLSPLLWVRVPPLVDFPNHLARMSVLARAGALSAASSSYIADWHLFPNLAMDLVVPPLAHALPLELAGRLFVGMTMALLILGTIVLHRVLHGRVGWWPLASLLFIYNTALWNGIVNYLFTLGLALLAFAGWIASERWQGTMRLIVFAVVASILFVGHLFAFGVYGLLIAFYELSRTAPAHRPTVASLAAFGRSLTQFVPAGVLWVLSLPNNRGGTFTTFGNLTEKLWAWTTPATFNAYPTALDKVTLAFSTVFVLAAIASGTLRLSRAMRLPVLAIVLAALVMPVWLSGGYGADWRLPVSFPFILIASTRFELTKPWQMPALAVCAILASGLLLTRIFAVTVDWQDMDRKLAEFRAAARVIPAGARLMVAQSPMPDGFQKIDGVPTALAYRRPSEFWHMGTLAVIDRGAFVVDLFTKVQPVAPSSRNAGLDRIHWRPLSSEELVEAGIA